jgi:hypothetical protein
MKVNGFLSTAWLRGLGPKETGRHFLFCLPPEPLFCDPDETSRVVGVVGDDLPVQAECIHGWRRFRVAILGPEHPGRAYVIPRL